MEERNGSNVIINIMPYILVGVIVIVCLFAFNIIPTNSNNSSSISFNEKSIRLEKNNGIQLSVNNTSNNIKFKSSNASIATVNEYTGYVTGVGIGTVTITAYIDGNEKIYDECTIEVYSKSSTIVYIDSLTLSETSLNMSVGESKKLKVTASPSNATEKKIIWSTTDSRVAVIDKDGVVLAKSSGTTIIKVRTESGKSASCTVTVTSKKNTPSTPINPSNSSSHTTATKIQKLVIASNKLNVAIGDTQKISYRIEPTNGEIRSINWSSANTNVATVDSNGNVTGKKVGSVEVTLNINGNLIGKVTVTVSPKITGINLKSSSNISLKIGNTSQISAETIPSNSGVSITYSSNNNHVTVSNNGLIKAVSAGTSVVTIKADSYTKTVNVTVNADTVPETPIPVSTSGVWGYIDGRTVNPVRADLSFFTELANKGIGSISGNVYTYAGYSYYTKTSNLVYNGRSSLIRIYYPKGVDLSNVNTFALFGGTGERNLGGFFSAIDKDTSKIKSGGIIILVSTSGSYHYQDAINATNFVKAITKQKSGKKNSVGGYSLGGPAAGGAMVYGHYDRLFILHSKVELSHTSKLKDKKIYVYSPKGDSQKDSTRTTLTALKNDGARKNVTVVTNDSSLINTFGSYFTIVNPGNDQGSGHGYANFVNGNLFAFACSN